MNMAKFRDIRGKIPSPKVIWNGFDQVAVNGVNSNNMSAYADQNHAPSLTDVRLEISYPLRQKGKHHEL